MDGAANQRGSGVGLVLISPEKITIEKSLRLGFSATNNEAEYKVFVDRNDDGPENGWKNSEVLFRFKANYGPSKRRFGSTGSKNVGVFEPSQVYTNKI